MRGHNVTMFPTIVECVLVATFEDGFWMYDTAEYEPKPFHDATEATPLAKDGA